MKFFLIVFLSIITVTAGLSGCNDNNSNESGGDVDSDTGSDSGENDTSADTNADTNSDANDDSDSAMNNGTDSESADAGCPDINDATAQGVTKLLEYSIFGFVEMGVWDNYYYFRKDNDLQRMNLDDLTTEELEETIGHVSVLFKDVFFWKEKDETDTYSVMSAPISDATSVTVVTSGISSPQFVGTDSNYLYLLFDDSNEIGRVPLTGGDVTSFLTDVAPVSITIHNGYIWWQDFTTESMSRASLDSDTGEPEVLTSIFYGGVMVGDGDTMYWADSSLGAIEKWNAEAGRVQLIGSSADQLAVVNGMLYWAKGFLGAGMFSMKTDGTEYKEMLCGFHSVDSFYATDSYLVANTSEGVFKIDI